MNEEVEVLTMEDLLESLADQVSHLSYGGDPDDTGQRQIPATEVIQWALAEIAKLRVQVATDIERAAIAESAGILQRTYGKVPQWPENQIAADMLGFLERTK